MMKRLAFVYLSILLGLASSPALAASQKEASDQTIPQSTVAPTTTATDTRLDSQMPRNEESMRAENYRKFYPRLREGGNHQKPQYNS